MPTELTLAAHLEGLRVALVALVRYADRAGPEAPVPTCPGWTVRDLVAHTGTARLPPDDAACGGRARRVPRPGARPGGDLDRRGARRRRDRRGADGVLDP